MGAGDIALNLIISADAGNATSVIAGLGTTLAQLSSGNVLGAVAAASAAVGAALVGAAKSAGDFNEGLTQLVTGAGESASILTSASGGLSQFSQQLLQMSVDTGTSTDQLVKGMYMIDSAGYTAAKGGLSVLQAAAEGARVGNADLATTAQALSGVLVNYHLPAQDAVNVTNALIKTVGDGQMHMQDLASSLGNVLPLAAALGVSFPQVAGAIAVMTNHEMDARRATMDLNNTLRSLAAPNAVAQKSMQAVGLSAQQLKDTLTTQGLTGAIQLVEDHVGKTFPAGSVQAVAAFKAIMGGATGYNIALMLGGKNMAAYEANVKDITAAMQDGSGSVLGWELVQADFNFKVSQAQQALNAMMITVGQELLPVFGKMVDWVTQAVMGFTAWESQTHFVEQALNAVVTAITWLADGLGKVMDVLGQLWGLVEPFFDDLTKSAVTWGQNFLVGFGQGVLSSLGDLVSVVAQVAQEIANYLGFASPTKKGPGSKLMSWGQGMMAGLAGGILSSMPLVTNAVTQVASNISTLGSPSSTPSMTPNVSTMVDKLTGDTRQVTVSPVARQAQQMAGGGTTTGPRSTVGAQMVQHISASLAAGAGTVKAAANAVGQQLHVVCSQHAKAASTCAADSLTHGLAAKLHAGKTHVSAASHALGTHLTPAERAAEATAKKAAAAKAAADKHAATLQAAAERKAAADAARTAKAAAKAGPPPVAGAVGSIGMDIPTLSTQAKNAATSVRTSFVQQLTPLVNSVKSIMAGVGNAFHQALVFMTPGFQAIGQAVQSNLLPALKNLGGAFMSLVGDIGMIVGWFLRLITSATAQQVAIALLKATWVVLSTTIVGLINGASLLINVLANVTTFFTKNQLAGDILIGVLAGITAGLIAFRIAALLPALPFLFTLASSFVAAIPAMVGMAATMLGGVVPALVAMAVAGWAALAPLLPFIAIGAAVALAVVGIIYAVQHWSDIVKWFQGVWTATVAAVQHGITAIGQWWSGVVAVFQKVGSNIQSALKSSWDWVVSSARNTWDTVIKTAQNAWNGLVYFFKGIAQHIVDAFSWLYQHNYYFQWLVDSVQKIFTGAEYWIKLIWGNIVNWLTGLWQGISNTATKTWASVSSAIKNVTSTIWAGLQVTWKQITTWLTDTWSTLVLGAQTVWGEIAQLFSSAWKTYIQKPLSDFWTSVSQWWTTFTNNSITFIKNVWTQIAKVVSSAWTTYIATPLATLWKNISQWFSTLTTNVQMWAGNMLKMFGQGITDGAHWALDALTTLGKNIAKILGFHSPPPDGPLAQSNAWMPNMMAMFGQGISQNSSKMTAPIGNVAQSINTQFSQLGRQVTNSTTIINSSVFDMGTTVINTTSQITPAMTQLSSQVQSSANSINTSMGGTVIIFQTTSQQAQQSAATIGFSVTTASTAVQTAGGQVSGACQSMGQSFSTLKVSFTKSNMEINTSSNEMLGNLLQGYQKIDQANQTFAQGFSEMVHGSFQAGLSDMMSSFAQTAQGITQQANALGQGLSNVLGFHSPPKQGPLSDSDQWMPNMVKMMSTGLQQNTPYLIRTATQVAGKLSSAFSPTLNKAFSLPQVSFNNDQKMDLQINLDGKQITKAIGVRIAREVRVQGNIRGV